MQRRAVAMSTVDQKHAVQLKMARTKGSIARIHVLSSKGCLVSWRVANKRRPRQQITKLQAAMREKARKTTKAPVVTASGAGE